MKILFFMFIPLFNLALNFICCTEEVSKVKSDTVYICGSGKGKKYHLTAHCRGLSNCSAKAVKTTLKQATREGKTRCAWEK
ncbi:hypothetical protein PQ465_15340 [Sphingobacterium oryzagri]|uniref:Uncharacterized protein n=1 Tax=Sphingobacterium oryzagri TaxID=3025669 RepID=A0ABY7WGD4_9SPHI|nr:hypothetical protein [Sphingobacterium sp. KACC 22765]WDF67674.1 hypothetical protein PQ465_15340 [Sphingobacterium sp. KACC 22765]